MLVDSLYYSVIDHLAEAIEQLGDEPLFRADMIEMTAQSLAGKMELIVQLTEQALLMSDPERCKYLEDEFVALGEGIDRLLVSHPTMRLEMAGTAHRLDVLLLSGNRYNAASEGLIGK